jgi:drug efflux transport system permease protein
LLLVFDKVWILLTGAVLFILCMLGVGLLISTVSAMRQQVLVTSFFFIMPAVTFSLLGFPISTMPRWLQYLIYAADGQRGRLTKRNSNACF